MDATELTVPYGNQASELIIREGHRKISTETAYFLNAAMKLNLEYENEMGGVDMCKAMEKKEKKDKIKGAIEIYREYGESEEFIIDKIMSKFGVTREYVLTILKAQVA
ncbi:MAG: hypothetical protein IKN24_06760 [Lachnospiraceae bacterium]|nr:hypothetical protein [Lachnospiraceae bacterium]